MDKFGNVISFLIGLVAGALVSLVLMSIAFSDWFKAFMTVISR
jgi:hypothetical protein